MKNKVIIIDYGMGNLFSIYKRLKLLKADVVISSSIEELKQADKIILPGVGHFEKAMQRLNESGLVEALNEQVLINKKPILGICLGMQLITNKSEEGNCAGLGWINVEVKKLPVVNSKKFKVPHTGWNQIKICKESKIMKDIPDYSEFYFVHAFGVLASEDKYILNKTTYESEFISAIENENIYGVQYHPEKSHDVGLQLLRNYIEL